MNYRPMIWAVFFISMFSYEHAQALRPSNTVDMEKINLSWAEENLQKQRDEAERLRNGFYNLSPKEREARLESLRIKIVELDAKVGLMRDQKAMREKMKHSLSSESFEKFDPKLKEVIQSIFDFDQNVQGFEETTRYHQRVSRITSVLVSMVDGMGNQDQTDKAHVSVADIDKTIEKFSANAKALRNEIPGKPSPAEAKLLLISQKIDNYYEGKYGKKENVILRPVNNLYHTDSEGFEEKIPGHTVEGDN